MTVFIDDQFLDRETCRRVRAAMDAGDAEDAEVLTDGIIVDGAVRRTSSIEVDEQTLSVVEQALDAARPRIAAFFGRALIKREGSGFLRYPRGGFYRPHRDRADIPEWPDAARRRVTLVAFLNDDFTGGALRLIPEVGSPRDITPRAGTLVAFDADTLHEVLPVAGGTRDTVVDWFWDCGLLIFDS
jgi:SM-20-related protein